MEGAARIEDERGVKRKVRMGEGRRLEGSNYNETYVRRMVINCISDGIKSTIIE